MDWNEQAETMAKTWAEAQKIMWDSWYDFGRAATGPSYGNIAGEWQEMFAKGVDAWTAEADTTAKSVAQRFAESQKMALRFFEFSVNTWQKIAEKAEMGEDWDKLLAEYSEQLRQQLIKGPEAMSQLGQDSGKLWQEYTAQMEKLGQPWLTAWQKSAGLAGHNGTGTLELSRLYWDTYDQTFGRFLSSPGLGYTREMDERVHRGFKAWQRYRRADFEYQLVVADAWVKLFDQFQRELVALAQQGDKIESLSALADMWMTIGDRVFIDVFRSEKYIQVQDELVSATMNHRIQQREVMEPVLKHFDIPTRREVDEAHRRIYEQKKQIKALKGALANQAEWSQTQQSVDQLKEELERVKAALSEVSAEAKQVEALRQDIETLKTSVAKTAKPKRTTKRTATKPKQRPKTSPSKEED